MNNCKCTYTAYPIPENYTGQLTIGQTSITNEVVTVYFRKSPDNVIMTGGIVDATGLLSVFISETEELFFSCHAGEYKIYATKDGIPVKFTSAAEKKVDCIAISFLEPDCDIVENTPFTLTENEEKICREC